MSPCLAIKTIYLEKIRSGQKTSTIRTSCRTNAGDVLTFTNYRQSIRTRCTSVERVHMDALTDAHARADGFDSLPELLVALRTHYPVLETVWVIAFVLEPANDSDHSRRAVVTS